MPCQYVVVRSSYKDKKGFHVNYGLALTEVQDGVATVLVAACDLSTSRKRVARLAGLCNQLQLDPLHFEDVVADFLG